MGSHKPGVLFMKQIFMYMYEDIIQGNNETNDTTFTRGTKSDSEFCMAGN